MEKALGWGIDLIMKKLYIILIICMFFFVNERMVAQSNNLYFEFESW